MRYAIAGSLRYFDAVVKAMGSGRSRPIDVIGPGKNLNDERAFLRALDLDALICIGYPHILKKATLAIPRLGCFNLHTSALPEYRGRHPVNWAMINGEPEIGITLHRMVPKIDAGPILYTGSVKVGRDDDIEDVHRKLVPIGVQMVRRLVSELKSGKTWEYSQSERVASYYPKRKPKDSHLDLNQPAFKVHRFVNALVGPGMPNAFAFASPGNRLMKFNRSRVGAVPGEVLAVTQPGEVVVSCGEGVAFLKYSPQFAGHELKVGDVLLYRKRTDQ